MKMKTQLILAFLMLTFVFAFGQEKRKIEFEKTTHDFGDVLQGDPTEFNFRFTNNSDEPVTLQRVKASCGCTTPQWTRDAVAPGAQGEIFVKYDSKRQGPFTKSITVTYDSVESPIMLYIKGKVNYKDDPNVALQYPMKQGNLSFDKVNEFIGVLESDKSKMVEFKVRNTGQRPITFTGKVESEMMMEASPAHGYLQPGQESLIRVNVDGGKFLEEGNFSKPVGIYTDDPLGEEKELTVSGSLKKVFSAAELAGAPKIEFEMTDYNGGNVIEGELVEVAYVFRNTGQSELEIESVKASCGCTATAPKDKLIAPGQTSEIVAKFDSRGRQGNQTKTITVKSNDPTQPNIVLKLSVVVEKDPFHSNEGPTAAPGSTGSFH